MHSASELAETLRSITNIKLKELSTQRATFEENKSYLLFAADGESRPSEKLKTLLDGCKRLSIQQKGMKHSALYNHLAQCIQQANYDPSINGASLKGEAQLRRELDVRSLRYEYASLYSQLVTEWTDSGPTSAPRTNSMLVAMEKEAHRTEWDSYVFQALQTNQDEITSYLARLFCSTTEAQASFEKLRKAIHQFEVAFTASDQVNDENMRWCVTGLLRSDLLNEQKKAALKDILNHKESLSELRDVLNMRLSTIDTWSWDKNGVVAEQRRQIDGKYRIFHNEDIIDALLLDHLGRKWSVKFKSAFADLLDLDTTTALTSAEKRQREHFLGPESGSNLSQKRHQVFRKENFMSQLLEREDEVLRGYEDYDQDDNVTFHRSHNDIKQSLLHLVSTEIVMSTRLHKNLCVIRSDFKRFGPSLSHSTIFAVMKFFGVSPKWLGFFRNALEGTYFLECHLFTWGGCVNFVLCKGLANSKPHISTYQMFRSYQSLRRWIGRRGEDTQERHCFEQSASGRLYRGRLV